MDTITVTKKEYKALVVAKRQLKALLKLPSQKSSKFNVAGFGVFKNVYGRKSSAKYIEDLRKAWR